MNKQRLLDVARACREAPYPEKFTMAVFVRPCGTPACALGNYAARTDLQSRFSLDAASSSELLFDNEPTHYHSGRVCNYFDIDDAEADELFGADGCGGREADEDGDGYVTDPIAAAKYIEDFVRRHEEPGESNVAVKLQE